MNLLSLELYELIELLLELVLLVQDADAFAVSLASSPIILVLSIKVILASFDFWLEILGIAPPVAVFGTVPVGFETFFTTISFSTFTAGFIEMSLRVLDDLTALAVEVSATFATFREDLLGTEFSLFALYCLNSAVSFMIFLSLKIKPSCKVDLMYSSFSISLLK